MRLAKFYVVENCKALQYTCHILEEGFDAELVVAELLMILESATHLGPIQSISYRSLSNCLRLVYEYDPRITREESLLYWTFPFRGFQRICRGSVKRDEKPNGTRRIWRLCNCW